jgi:hypothetical protein
MTMFSFFLRNLYPDGLCHARTRKGTPCKIRQVFKCKNGNLRCKYHGGLCTGAKTQEGQARINKALKAWHLNNPEKSKAGRLKAQEGRRRYCRELRAKREREARREAEKQRARELIWSGLGVIPKNEEQERRLMELIGIRENKKIRRIEADYQQRKREIGEDEQDTGEGR